MDDLWDIGQKHCSSFFFFQMDPLGLGKGYYPCKYKKKKKKERIWGKSGTKFMISSYKCSPIHWDKNSSVKHTNYKLFLI